MRIKKEILLLINSINKNLSIVNILLLALNNISE